MLLCTFFLNIFDFLTRESRVYLVLNLCGAGIACYASYLIDFWPFVVLEGAWFSVGMTALLRRSSAIPLLPARQDKRR